jgi:peptidoglycan/LPS O-acetylase OafA/YrhL
VRGKLPALDGVRGIAILLVVAAHAQLPGMMGAGTAGVTLFFVLSGFLISGLLLHEQSTHGTIAVGRFWQRRAIRLLPALLAFLTLTSLLLLALGATAEYVGSGVFWSLSYAMNWAMSANLYHGPLGFAWSLAVEEQFYLLWPLLLPLVLRTGRPLRWLVGLAVASAALRLVMFSTGSWSWWRAYAGTDVNAYALLLGAGLAVLRARGQARLPSWAGPVALAAFTCTFLVENLLPYATAELWAFSPAFALAGVVLLAAAADDPGWLAPRWLTYFGAVSYGWYLWHCPLTATVEKQGGGMLLATVVAVIALGLAEVSRRYVEQPFSSWARSRFALAASNAVDDPQCHAGSQSAAKGQLRECLELG